jgi:hypothetical protein
MLRIVVYAFLIAALVFFSALIGMNMMSSREQPQAPQNQSSAQGPQTAEPQTKGPESFGQWLSRMWDATTGDPIALFTAFLALFSFSLLVVSVVQIVYLNRADTTATLTAKAAQQSADTARAALVNAQRAFVFVASFEANQLGGDFFTVAANWKNSGTTPTKNLIIYSFWKYFPEGLLKDYRFPDLSEDGKELVGPAPPFSSLIGPQGNVSGRLFPIPMAIIKAIGDGKGAIYLWGRAEYNDIFPNTPRHITKYCNKIATVAQANTGGQPSGMVVTFPTHPTGNCADEECGK